MFNRQNKVRHNPREEELLLLESKCPDLARMYPNGWDMSRYNASMAEMITGEEFNDRVSLSISMTALPF